MRKMLHKVLLPKATAPVERGSERGTLLELAKSSQDIHMMKQRMAISPDIDKEVKWPGKAFSAKDKPCNFISIVFLLCPPSTHVDRLRQSYRETHQRLPVAISGS